MILNGGHTYFIKLMISICHNKIENVNSCEVISNF